MYIVSNGDPFSLEADKIKIKEQIKVQKRCLRWESINHVSISDQNQIQPSTTPPSARCYSELPSSGLQQIPCFLKYNKRAWPRSFKHNMANSEDFFRSETVKYVPT